MEYELLGTFSDASNPMGVAELWEFVRVTGAYAPATREKLAVTTSIPLTVTTVGELEVVEHAPEVHAQLASAKPVSGDAVTFICVPGE
jgi:hypothetical protein